MSSTITTTTVEARTPSGKHVVLTLGMSSISTQLRINATVDGKPMQMGMVQSLEARSSLPMGGTHVLGTIVFDAANAALIAAAIEAKQAEIDALPEAKMDRLREERGQLVAAVNGATDAWGAARDRAFNADTGKGWIAVNAADAKITEAQARLDAFDTEHPEIKTALDAERAAAVDRFLAND